MWYLMSCYYHRTPISRKVIKIIITFLLKYIFPPRFYTWFYCYIKIYVLLIFVQINFTFIFKLFQQNDFSQKSNKNLIKTHNWMCPFLFDFFFQCICLLNCQILTSLVELGLAPAQSKPMKEKFEGPTILLLSIMCHFWTQNSIHQFNTFRDIFSLVLK